VLNVISLAQFSITYARGRAANSVNARVPLKAGNDLSLVNTHLPNKSGV